MKIVTSFLIALIQCYQKFISRITQPSCRFYPTCSNYAVDALTKRNLPTAFYLIIKRIAKCHPFHPGGIDKIGGSNV